ncbi:uncharacterized protein LOC135101691 [Scylla paramamosain]|uniref:uncharacterized protein LOC135101691 n=1 Tax=Scylla paramamosain TaxID=85552 RepID=UPI0030836A69
MMEKYREGQKELYCVFINLEKAYDRVPREELWYCMRCLEVAEKYVKVAKDRYENNVTVVRCAAGMMEGFKVEVGLHQGLALSPFLFAGVMDRLTDERRHNLFREDDGSFDYSGNSDNDDSPCTWIEPPTFFAKVKTGFGLDGKSGPSNLKSTSLVAMVRQVLASNSCIMWWRNIEVAVTVTSDKTCIMQALL